MKLSVPIYRLKRQARIFSRQESIPYHQALDLVAREEGFDSWSLLASCTSEVQPSKRLKTELQRGDLVLIAARPGQGKTLLSLEIAVDAMKAGQRCVFFSLECTEADVRTYFTTIGEELECFADIFDFDDSDDICGTYVANRLQSATPGTIVVIDYLQLLDQKRATPTLTEQIRQLRAFAKERRLIMVFLSQVHRSYDPTDRPVPTLDDVRLPNPLDLRLFDKSCFLHDGNLELSAIR